MRFRNLGLMPGDVVKFRSEKKVRKATVVKEYSYFVLLDLGKYQVSANKASLYCGDEALTRINKG